MTITDYSSKRGGFGFEVHGEASYQPALRRVNGGRRERGEEVYFKVFLWPEPTNSRDANAVAVCAESHGVIGHIPREHAAAIQAPLIKMWADHQIVRCSAKLIGGVEDKPTLGVVLSLDTTALVGHRLMQT